jgi:hypothetical protein
VKGISVVQILLTFWLATAHAQFSGRFEMNGIAYKELRQFSEQWPLVTVRYRQDTHELRFTYANDKAMAALKHGDGMFADGAIFAKIGRMTEEDPAFTSSLVPSGTKRYQFMVRDAKKYAATGGWGYALFDKDGKTFNDDPKRAAEACAACHALAKTRGYVFSQPMGHTLLSTPTALRFEKIRVKDLPEEMRRWIPVNEREAYALDGDLRKNPFPGTLDEIAPALETEVLKTRQTAFLLSEDHRRFSLVIIDKLNKSCVPANDVSLLSIRGAPEITGGVAKKSYCAKP